VLTSLSKFESQTQILNSHTQSIAKLEIQLGQLNHLTRESKGSVLVHLLQILGVEG
jgi:hypothetical protein